MTAPHLAMLLVGVVGVTGGLDTVAAGTRAMVPIRVMAVKAAPSGPTAGCIQKVRRQFGPHGYESFQLVQDERRLVPLRSQSLFALPDGHMLRLQPVARRGNAVQVEVRLLAGGRRLVDAKMLIPDGSHLFYVVGPAAPHDDPATVILIRSGSSARPGDPGPALGNAGLGDP